MCSLKRAHNLRYAIEMLTHFHAFEFHFNILQHIEYQNNACMIQFHHAVPTNEFMIVLTIQIITSRRRFFFSYSNKMSDAQRDGKMKILESNEVKKIAERMEIKASERTIERDWERAKKKEKERERKVNRNRVSGTNGNDFMCKSKQDRWILSEWSTEHSFKWISVLEH